MSVVPSEIIDCDGPWVYLILQHFIKLYLDNNKHIPFNILNKFVEKYYTFVTKQIKNIITNQLYKYQHQIFDKQTYKVYNFQYDQYDDQFTLYKHLDYDRYDDAGEIWIRMKNYGLSVPLMDYCRIPEQQYSTYQNDIYDTLQCNQHIKYANMFKQLTNNAVQFGVFQNILWILGYTSYVELHEHLIESTDYPYLKLACVQFSKNKELNTLELDITTIKSFSLYDQQDNLDSIDQFIGQYFNQNDKSLEFVLYNKEKHISNILENIDLYDGSPVNVLTEIPIRICQYLVEQPSKKYIDTNISGYMPTINVNTLSAVNDFQTYKNKINSIKNIEDYYGNIVVGTIITGFDNNIIPFNGKILYNDKISSVIEGTWIYKTYDINNKLIETPCYLTGIVNIDNTSQTNPLIFENVRLFNDKIFGDVDFKDYNEGIYR